MIAIFNLKEVTYPIYKLDNEIYLIGVKTKFQIRSYLNDDLRYEFEFNECSFTVFRDSIYFYVGSSLIKYDFKTEKETLFFETKKNSEIWFFNEFYLFEATRTAVRGEFDFFLHNILEDKIKWSEKSNKRLSSISNNYLLFTDIFGSIYKRKNIENGADIWSLDFSENRIFGNVLLINNVLIFSTTNQDLIGIEIETGKELWRLNNINVGTFQVHPGTNYLVSLNSNSFGDNWYFVINPLNGEIVENKHFPNFFLETSAFKACITATHYYFISNVIGGTGANSDNQTHLGCINLQTHEIEWIEKIDEGKDRYHYYQKPEINNGKIYLLDGEQTLHIYEIE